MSAVVMLDIEKHIYISGCDKVDILYCACCMVGDTKMMQKTKTTQQTSITKYSVNIKYGLSRDTSVRYWLLSLDNCLIELCVN